MNTNITQIDGAYITNHMYGGYRGQTERGRFSKSYTDPSEVIDVAREHDLDVSLAGGTWTRVGEDGWGQKVDPETAEMLVEQLRSRADT
ncbi:MAG: hypothetical protein ABEN55_00400 [Bradymonadaceae bacterium]